MLWEVYPQVLFELESWLFFRLKHLFSHPKPHYWPSLACKKEDKWAYIDCKLKKPTGLDLETQITLLKKKKKKRQQILLANISLAEEVDSFVPDNPICQKEVSQGCWWPDCSGDSFSCSAPQTQRPEDPSTAQDVGKQKNVMQLIFQQKRAHQKLEISVWPLE